MVCVPRHFWRQIQPVVVPRRPTTCAMRYALLYEMVGCMVIPTTWPQTWACDGIDRAMDEYEAIKKDVGSGATLVEMVSQVGFASLLADSMVQRVALRRCVGYGTRKTDLNNWSINWRREAAQPHLHSKAEKVLRQLEGDAFTPP